MIRYDYGPSSSQEMGESVHEARDGGYLVGADVFWREGGPSAGLIRLDAYGNIRWQKSYSRTGEDPFASLEETSGGGYFLATSGLEDVTYSPYTEDWALSIQKLDMDGNVTWQSVYGTSSDGPFRATVLETHDGGYLLAGGERGRSFFIKLDAERHVQWEKRYGQAWIATLPADDGGYVALLTDTPPGRRTLAKLDAYANVEWVKTYDMRVDLRSMQKTRDGGFILAGFVAVDCLSCVDALDWQADLSVLKVDSRGEIQWQRAYGGLRFDAATKVLQTSDGGYVVLGYTDSSYIEVNGDGEVWLMKLDGNGNIQWQRTYGRQSTSDIRYEEKPFSIQQTADGGYIVAGLACAQGSAAPYGCDVLVLRLDSEGSIPGCPLMGSGPLGTDVTNITSASGTLEPLPSLWFKSLDSSPARISETNATANVECSYTPPFGIKMTMPETIVFVCIVILAAITSIVVIKRIGRRWSSAHKMNNAGNI